MRVSFAYGLKEIVAAAILSCFVAGGVCAMTGPAANEAKGNNAISINRALKGDRLPVAATARQQPNPSSATQMSPAAHKRAPLGCDPAFSPVVEPAMAHIFKRCMV